MFNFRTARSYTVLSIAAAVVTIVLKTIAYRVTGSIGLLSDALESGINLIAAVAAFWALSMAAQPADNEHPFGHDKAEYFSSGLESILIVIAAIAIMMAAYPKLFVPQPLEQLDWGLTISAIATLINGVVAWVMLRAGKRLRSITLRADAHHLLTDVWTSIGVAIGILLVKITGWLILDPILAILVAANILVTGFRLLKETGAGLLDTALPPRDLQKIEQLLDAYRAQDIQFHALRTRVAGSRIFINIHVLVPGEWTVTQGHDLCDRLEHEIIRSIHGAIIITHLEPIDDPKSWTDIELLRIEDSG
jgi:cation diffusion facilitator family transporter